MSDHSKKPPQAPKKPQQSEQTPSDQMDGRRRLLKSLVIGGGAVASGQLAPKEWKKPLVEAVLVPGHASGSSPIGSVFRTSNDVFTSVDPAGPSSFDPLEMLVPSAQADTVNGCQVQVQTFAAMYDLMFGFNPNNSVDVCVEVASPLEGGVEQSVSTLNNDNSLDDINFGPDASLTNMSFDPGSFVVNGTFTLSFLGCPPDSFSAPLFPGPFFCAANVTTNMEQWDPLAKKTDLA